ncbi:MAG: hypothetical protein C5S46_02480 [Candidatus Methanomarinus sp.]|uniref:Uncharacterized protein n=1 Tax=Candidatus Methanomarinus sp. TaxID=3386244 RepID=A0AC61SBW8_9EURY|nr:MAG: hypothetical protein C5S46_02480 [ANME-2 cluster archaeon]
MTNPSANSLIVLAAFIIGALTNYAYNISMGWLLTPEQYGMLGVSLSFLLILSLFITSAFPLTVTKFISGEYNESIKHQVFKTSLIANIIIAIILSALFYLGYITDIIKLGIDYYLLVLCIILATLLTSAMVVYSGILQGTFRFKSFAYIGIIVLLIKLIFALIFVQAGLKTFGALLALPISVFIGLILTIILTKDFTFYKTKGWAGSNVYFFALPMFFGTLAATLLMNIDILGVKFLTIDSQSDTLSGYYRAALILAQLPMFLAGALMSVMFPYISKHTENDQYSLKSIKYAALFILPISLILAAVPESFILIIFPVEYTAGAPALGIVAIGMGLLGMATVFTRIFQARQAPMIPAVVLSISVLIEIILLIYLIPEYGLVGAAASTTIASALGFFVLGILYLRVFSYKLNFIVIIKTIVSFCLLVLLVYASPDMGSAVFIAYLAVCGMVYVIVLAVFSLLTEEDVSIFISGLPEHKNVVLMGDIITGLVKRLNRFF